MCILKDDQGGKATFATAFVVKIPSVSVKTGPTAASMLGSLAGSVAFSPSASSMVFQGGSSSPYLPPPGAGHFWKVPRNNKESKKAFQLEDEP